MDATRFKDISSELSSIIDIIPPWGSVQNNLYDSSIDMFEVSSFAELENKIVELSPKRQQYFRRRWFLWQCSRCDEYLFALNPNVTLNPNAKDYKYDLVFNGQVVFDLKGTIIPRPLQGDVEGCLQNPQKLIDSYYERQSTGTRNHMQDRLFLVHHSYVDPKRELHLRCAWDFKRDLFRFFSENFSCIIFREYNGCKVGLIFILEPTPGNLTFLIDGLTP